MIFFRWIAIASLLAFIAVPLALAEESGLARCAEDYQALVARRPLGVREGAPLRVWRQLDPSTRFIPTQKLEKSFLSRPVSITNKDGEVFQLAAVKTDDPEVALRVSGVLSRSIEKSRASERGHIPDVVVDRVQDVFVSPESVQTRWGTSGYRYVLFRQSTRKAGESEVLGTILVSKDHETIFFLSGSHDNLEPVRDPKGAISYYVDRYGQMVDQGYVKAAVPSDLPPLEHYKPEGYHQIVNFAFVPEIRGGGLAKKVLTTVIRQIRNGEDGTDGKPLYPRGSAGGFWQVGEPPWQERMRPMNFRADPSQHAYLLPVNGQAIQETGGVTHTDFNESWGVLEEYCLAIRKALREDGKGRALSPDLRARLTEALKSPALQAAAIRLRDAPERAQQLSADIEAAGVRFPERLPALVEHATNGKDKLQYKVLEATFEDVEKSGPR
jgi:hypothetical protein